MTGNTDRIEKKILLRAPRERVWRAISDSQQFGIWFGVAFDGPFVAGTRVRGTIVPTQVDAEVARMQERFAGEVFHVDVERVDPMDALSFRWHPYSEGSEADYLHEPTTLVSFDLQEVTGGVMLTITESGFDQLPLERREQAFTMNEGGWQLQCRMIASYLAREAA